MSHDRDQSHGSGQAGHSHGVSADADTGKLGIALALILGLMAVEVTAGAISRSLALLSDAGHMLTDAAAIGLSLIAARLARRPAKGIWTYGFKRVEILSAQANGPSWSSPPLSPTRRSAASSYRLTSRPT